MTVVNRAIDCLVNVSMVTGDDPPDWLVRVKEDYFKGGQSFLADADYDQIVDEMDRLGVRRAILMTDLRTDAPEAREFVDKAPERFSLGVGGLDLLRPMRSLKILTETVANAPVSYVSVGPSFWGDGNYPPSDAVYYPLYTKACELELPVTLNTGLPGPPLPGEPQNPIHLDRVCQRFPELKLVMMHGADPWWELAIRLMIKYRNLHLMTSAWSPKYLPESLLHYMRTRGKKKIIFASDSPVLSMTRTITEAAQLDLDPEVLDNYLYGNAERFFFNGGEDR
ncbi:amidohydrolase family protein [Microtetraspora sp. NBRC 16547]|uniref:amidohydrolase family protein n=1 Tax=Microtetraspora sp. NBRC 16547 TaxID=3030993 RepID=UPI0024A44973|nr:amidohydrolase family protein [Microtetraspora sp. NBRC 16547]GLX02655.1 amidohydrolase [Microtetraspora sp. NBRC 16547]